MNILVGSFGGYGNFLQAYTINKLYPETTFMIGMNPLQDIQLKLFKKADISLVPRGKYTHYLPGHTLIDLTLEEKGRDLIETKLNNLSKIPNKYKLLNKHIQRDNKEAWKSISRQLSPNTTYVIKPNGASGSRGVMVSDKIDYDYYRNNIKGLAYGEFIIQEHIPGDEYLIDCVVSPESMTYTIRKSCERLNGRDSKVSFNFEDNELNEIEFFLNATFLNQESYTGAFNIQCRMTDDNKLKVMELDYRLTESCTCNKSYFELIDAYLKHDTLPFIKTMIKNITFIEPGEFSTLYSDACKLIELSPAIII